MYGAAEQEETANGLMAGCMQCCWPRKISGWCVNKQKVQSRHVVPFILTLAVDCAGTQWRRVGGQNK